MTIKHGSPGFHIHVRRNPKTEKIILIPKFLRPFKSLNTLASSLMICKTIDMILQLKGYLKNRSKGVYPQGIEIYWREAAIYQTKFIFRLFEWCDVTVISKRKSKVVGELASPKRDRHRQESYLQKTRRKRESWTTSRQVTGWCGMWSENYRHSCAEKKGGRYRGWKRTLRRARPKQDLAPNMKKKKKKNMMMLTTLISSKKSVIYSEPSREAIFWERPEGL